jgi:hypothetical protein
MRAASLVVPRSPAQSSWWVLIPLLIYLSLSVPNLRLPGMYYDEALQILPAMDFVGYPVNEDYRILRHAEIGIGDQQFPVMLTSYLGALEAAVFVPVFAILPATVEVARLTFITLGTGTILLAFLWGRQLFGVWGGLALALLLATDATYITFTRVDNGPVNTMMLIKLGACICFSVWWRQDRARWFWAGCFLLGLGVYNKADFLWFIGAAGITLLLFLRQPIVKRLWGQWRLLLVGFGWSIIGAAPFLAYIVLSGGGPFRSMLESFGSTAFGVDNTDVLGNITARISSFWDVLSGYGALQTYFTPFAGEPVPYSRLWSLQPTLMVGTVALLPLLTIIRRHDPLIRVAAGAGLMMVLIILFSAFTPTNLMVHHLIMVYPFQQVLLVAVGMAFVRGLARHVVIPGRTLALTTAGVVMLANAAIMMDVHRLLRETGGTGMWSASIYDLNEYLLAQDKPVACMDWGLCHSLQMLSGGQLQTRDVWQRFLYPQGDPALMQELLAQQAIFVFHAPRYTGVRTITDADYPRQAFEQGQAALGIEYVPVTFQQQIGDEVYAVYLPG